AMLERARLLLRHVRDLKATSADGVLIGELRLGATATALTGMMPAILSSLAAAHPQIEIYIVPGVSVELYHQVVS
ncbi:LysR substrate-binding domain-containing protein, partial [Streptococcus pneumoniae]|uniref:LysR substrate-binding domain-containing protein n=1 Tax=Streptococcus pneumoniae TaxID=1313 RepID=UPI001EF8DDB7